jgi:molybdopterin/thiamine biosynthesis adenylyltransferase
MIGALDEAGYVEDAEAAERSPLAAEERERFKANLHYFTYESTMSTSSFLLQERLRQARITIIGVGTLGAGVLFNLACLGVSSVRIVDFDTVERSNLNRQMLYNEGDLGRKKIDAAAAFLERFRSDMQVEKVDAEIASTASAKEVVAGSDMVVLAADQPFVRLERWVNEACMELRVPWIGGGVQVTEGMFYTVLPGRTGCIECNDLAQNAADPSRSAFLEEFLASGFRMPSTAIAPVYMLLIGAVSNELARYVTGCEPLRSEGRAVAIDFRTYASDVRMDFSTPHPECPLCSRL